MKCIVYNVKPVLFHRIGSICVPFFDQRALGDRLPALLVMLLLKFMMYCHGNSLQCISVVSSVYFFSLRQLDCGIHPGLSGMDCLPYTDAINASEVDLLLVSQSVTFTTVFFFLLQFELFKAFCFFLFPVFILIILVLCRGSWKRYATLLISLLPCLKDFSFNCSVIVLLCCYGNRLLRVVFACCRCFL